MKIALAVCLQLATSPLRHLDSDFEGNRDGASIGHGALFVGRCVGAGIVLSMSLLTT